MNGSCSGAKSYAWRRVQAAATAAGESGGNNALRVQVQAFEAFMRQRFLAGGDAAFVDYAAIDGDVALDEFWAREEALDAQERYFDCDDGS